MELVGDLRCMRCRRQCRCGRVTARSTFSAQPQGKIETFGQWAEDLDFDELMDEIAQARAVENDKCMAAEAALKEQEKCPT